MKLEHTLGIIGSIIILVLIGYYVGAYQRQTATLDANLNLANTATNGTNTATPGQTTTLNLITIAQHNSAQDCWLIINNNVYAVTGYLNSHPGGTAIVVPYCGRDASTAFATQGGRGSHSSLAVSELKTLLIGQIGGTTTTNSIQQATDAAASLPGTRGDEEENEYEDD